MQIFLLDEEPVTNVSYYVDKHVVKTPSEVLQILINACARMRIKYPPIKLLNGIQMMPSTNVQNNPFCKWASKKPANFNYLLKIGLNLCVEYELRFHHAHFHTENFILMPAFATSNGIPELERYPWMIPFVFQDKEAGLIQSYRNYYFETKHHLATWSPPRSAPSWFPKEKIEEGRKIAEAFSKAKKEGRMNVDGVLLTKKDVEV